MPWLVLLRSTRRACQAMSARRKKRSPAGGTSNHADDKARAAQARMRWTIASLVAKHQLTELEGSWLLKAWELDEVAKACNRLACYVAGFMAGIAFKIVEQEFRTRRRP